MLTRDALKAKLRTAPNDSTDTAKLDESALDHLAMHHWHQLLAISDEGLESLYKTALKIPNICTQEIIESKCGIRLNGTFVSSTSTR